MLVPECCALQGKPENLLSPGSGGLSSEIKKKNDAGDLAANIWGKISEPILRNLRKI